MDPTEEQPETPEEEAPDTEDTDPAAPAAETTPAERPSKKERRIARADEHNARREASELREQLRQEGERRAALEASVSELRGYVSAQSQRQQPGEDDATKEMNRLQREARAHLNNAGAARTQEGIDAEMAAYHEKLMEAASIKAQKKMAGEFDRIRQERPNPEMMATQQSLTAEYPWFMTHKSATHLAGAIEEEMLSEGKPRTMATTKAALAEAAKRMNLGGHAPASQQQRGAYSGIPSREGAPGNGGGERLSINPASLEKWQQKLAEKAYPELESDQAHKAWARLMNNHFKSQNGTR